MKDLAGFKQLQKLYLGHTRITDTGLKELAGMKQLQDLYLLSTSVSDPGVAELQKALPKCKILR
jgi:hypothetical protein